MKNKKIEMVRITTRQGETVVVPRSRMPGLPKIVKHIKLDIQNPERKDKSGKMVARLIRWNITEKRLPAETMEEIRSEFRRSAKTFVETARQASVSAAFAVEKLLLRPVAVARKSKKDLSGISKEDLTAIRLILSDVENGNLPTCKACITRYANKIMLECMRRVFDKEIMFSEHDNGCRFRLDNIIDVDGLGEPSPVGKPDERGFQMFSDGSFSQVVDEKDLHTRLKSNGVRSRRRCGGRARKHCCASRA